MSKDPDIGGMPLADAFNLLRGPVSFERLADSIDRRVGAQTLMRLGDPGRPFSQPMMPGTLVKAAEAINTATTSRTTPWALWIAHGIQFERTSGLWGRPDDRVMGAVGLLPPGWVDLSQDRFRAWIAGGAAFVDQQRAADNEAEIRRLRVQLAEADAKVAALEATQPAKPARRTTKP